MPAGNDTSEHVVQVQVLVLETCSGLVTGAVAERLGGFGHVCTTYLGDKCPPLEATRMLNFSDSIKQSMSTAPLATLLKYQAQPTADGSPASVDAAEQAKEHIEAQINGQAEQQSSEGQPDRHLNGQPEQPRQHQQEAGSPISLSLQHQQVAGMNGACMRGLLDANSEQPQRSVLAGLSCSLQPETGTAIDGSVTLLFVLGLLALHPALPPAPASALVLSACINVFGSVSFSMLCTHGSTCDVHA